MKILLSRLGMDVPVMSVRRCVALALCALLLTSTASPVFAQRRTAVRVASPSARPATPRTKGKSTAAERRSQANAPGRAGAIRGLPAPQDEGEPLEVIWTGEEGIGLTTSKIMARQRVTKVKKINPRSLKRELKRPDRKGLPPAPGAQALSQWPPRDPFAPDFAKPESDISPSAPQTLGTQFDGATGPADTGAFPPDTMGAVGPTQFFVFLNGRLRTFNKTTGVADGVINADSDVFFASVMTPPNAGEVVFTSDPNVRYDRLTGRWFVTIIDVPLNVTTFQTRSNRVLIAVSDAASSSALTAGTVWTFYQFVADASRFTDYPSLGIDANALYIGSDQFSNTTGAFSNTRALIIPKAPFLTGAALTVFAANNLINGAGGPFAPRGVDNPDPANTGMTATGYFIGTDFVQFNRLALRRLTNPGAVGGSPSISPNIFVTTPLATNVGTPVPHLGNTVTADTNGDGFPDGNLDQLDDRLYAAVLRNGRLWTAHNIGVSNAGVATPNAAGGTAANDRNAARWYELQNLGTTPAVLQSGTVFDNAATNPRSYWIPSIAVSGQGHAALGSSIAGNNERINAFTTGRLVGDTLGALRDGPGTPPGYTASSTAYNPPGDPGPNRRWGDYSFVSLDPLDDMTLWTIQEYCNGTNTYGVRAVKLFAPPPATPTTAVPSTVLDETPSTNVVITGTSVNGSGFYDPGPNLAAPALAFNHISATVTGGVTVNSVTYNSPTQVTLNISTVGASLGPQNVTITNPDGQSLTGTALINVNPLAPMANAGQVLISEFRFRGPSSTADEFVELYNNTDSTIDISGFTLHALTAAGAQALRHTVPGALASNTTLIPARGHYLITGSAYTLPATANGSLSTGIVEGSGIGLFAGATPTSPTRIDSAGFDTRDALFFEGTAITPSSNVGAGGITVGGEYSFVRKVPTATRLPQDTGDNNADFTFVSTTGGLFSTRQSVLGAPGPENLASPLYKTFAQVADALLDQTQAVSLPPNRVRNAVSYIDTLTPSAPNGGAPATNPYTLGTLSTRRRFTNNTGVSVTRLRFRVIDITTGPTPPPGTADLRALTSGLVVVANITDPATCFASTGSATTPCTVNVQGTTVEQPPTQASGGGLNSTTAAGTVTLGTPLANGASINLQFLFGVVQGGTFRAFIIVEALS